MIYALLAPLILPISFLAFGTVLICFRYKLLYTSNTLVDHGGLHYFHAIFQLFWGVITSELCLLGLFILKISPTHLGHDVGQIVLLSLTLFSTIQYRKFLRHVYEPHLKSHGMELHLQPPHSPVQRKFQAARSDLPRWCDSSFGTAIANTVIWLPKDPFGISDILIQVVSQIYFDPGDKCCSNSGAEMKLSGQVILKEKNPPAMMGCPENGFS